MKHTLAECLTLILFGTMIFMSAEIYATAMARHDEALGDTQAALGEVRGQLRDNVICLDAVRSVMPNMKEKGQ